VRYRTGDVAVLWTTERCACGRGLPMLREIQGRTTDFVVAADGTVMHGLALIYTVRDLVAGAGTPADAEARIVRDFKARLGASVNVVVERVAEIPPERSGKHRYVVSKVAVPGPREPSHA
jgi:phenylacetate-CoA ligase